MKRKTKQKNESDMKKKEWQKKKEMFEYTSEMYENGLYHHTSALCITHIAIEAL